MSNLKNINSLVIKLHDYRVGIINRLAGDRYLFSFEQDYINDPLRPTLSLSFKGQAGGLVTSVRPYNLRLPPFFSNLLPEGHLRNYLMQRAEIKKENEFLLLAALGVDLPGAVTAIPLQTAEQIDSSKIIINNHNKYLSDNVMRFSLAGVQLKFSAIMEASGGLTIPADGMSGHWIVKLPSAQFTHVPENEFVMLALARQIGIALPQNRLINVKEIRGLPKDAKHLAGKALAVERFDRGADGQRIHMEDFAQVFGMFPDDKYEKRSYANIAAVLWAEVGDIGTYEFVRRLVFSVLIGNADMHLKNWSLLYPGNKTPVLSPAYDFVSTVPYISNDNLALNFGGSKSLNEISRDQIRRFADTALMPANPVYQLVIETIERTVDAWKTLSEKELLPRDMLNVIDKQIHKVTTNTLRLLSR